MPRKRRVHAQLSEPNEPNEPGPADSPRRPEALGHGANLDRGAPSEVAGTARGRVRDDSEASVEPQRAPISSAADRRSDEPDYGVNGRSADGDDRAGSARESD